MLNILLIAGLIATASTLCLGVIKMMKGSQYGSNKMMLWRVFFQALTLIILTFFLFSR